MSLKNLIAGSYGIADNMFAGHPLDAGRARQALINAGDAGVGLEEYLNLHREYLRSRGCSDEHIERELGKVQNISYYFDAD